MDAFATEAQYRALYDTDLDGTRLQAFLEKASRRIASSCAAHGADTGDLDAEILADVCIDMVHRAIGDGEGASIPYGATQYSESATPYTVSVSLGNPYDDLFMRKSDYELLGIPLTRIGYASPMANAMDGDGR